MATTAELELRRRGALPVNEQRQPDLPSWTPPGYQGTDPAYLAWLANARLRGSNATTDAKTRRAQTEEAYRQALLDLDTQAVSGRKQIQSNMLGRGIFRSGETDRRKTEFDSAIEQGKGRALTAETNQFGQIDTDQRNALASLGMEGATQVSQAILRDQLAAYNAQQTAANTATPAATYTAAPAVPTATTATPGSPSYLKPTTQQAGADPRYRLPVAKPKVASGSTGSLKLGSKKLQ